MMATFIEDDNMEINEDYELAQTSFSTANATSNGCCYCVQRHIRSTHRFRFVPAPPPAHLENMFTPRGCVQPQPQMFKNSDANAMPLDLTAHTTDTPVRNGIRQHSSDTGFDSPMNCEIIYGGVSISHDIPVPQANIYSRTLEPVQPLNSFTTNLESVAEVYAVPVLEPVPPVNGLTTNLKSVDNVYPVPVLELTDPFDTSLEFNSSVEYNVEEEQQEEEEEEEKSSIPQDNISESNSKEFNSISNTVEQELDNFVHQNVELIPSNLTDEHETTETTAMEYDSDNDDVISIYACSNG